jgi:hypothetical protein
MMNGSIKYREGYKYQLAEPYVIDIAIKPDAHVSNDFLILSPEGVLIINKGYAWDGPSGPTIDTDNFMRGSLVHDALYQLMREGLIDLGWRETADRELQRICKEDGMSSIRAWWVYRGVRFGGESSAKWQVSETLTAPMILLCFALLACIALSSCMAVKVESCGTGNVTINLDKEVSTLPIKADGNTVKTIP